MPIRAGIISDDIISYFPMKLTLFQAKYFIEMCKNLQYDINIWKEMVFAFHKKNKGYKDADRDSTVRKQKLDIVRDVTIIYGYNNSGKTTILKVIDDVFRNMLMEKFIRQEAGELAVYISTNRVIDSESNTEELHLKDCEELMHYQKDSYRDYSLHLKRLRDQLMADTVTGLRTL